MKHKLLFLVAFASLLFSIPSLLAGDDFFQVKNKILDESRFKLGFLYFTPLFLIESVGYVSSIYTYEDRENPDWTGDFGLGLRASAIAANRLILQAEDLPVYSFYLENENLRAWNNRFHASAWSYTGPFNFKAGFRRHDIHQRPRLEFSRPYRFSDSEWSGEVDIGSRDNLFLTLYAAFSQLRYKEEPVWEGYDLDERLNHDKNALGIKLNKRVFTSTIAYLNYERISYRFLSSRERDASAQQAAIGVVLPDIGALTGSFQIGLRRFQPNQPLFRRVQSPNGKGDVSLRLADRLRLNASYELDTLFSYASSDLFYDNHQFGLGAELYLTRFLKAGARYSDGRLKFRSFLDLQVRRRDRIRQQRYYLAVPVVRNIALGFSYNVYRLTSDELGLDYTRDFWGGFLSYDF